MGLLFSKKYCFSCLRQVWRALLCGFMGNNGCYLGLSQVWRALLCGFVVLAGHFVVFSGHIVVFSPFVLAEESQLNKLIDEQIKNHQAGAESQKKVSALADETEDIVGDYEVTLRQIEDARAYNQQLKTLIEDQNQEKDSIRVQIKEVKQTGKEIMPLMLEMLKNLESFVSLDIPFLMEERQKRLKELKTVMDRADISVSEKYRKLMEAYQVESEYGRTLEAYQGFQDIEGKKWNVNYLRIGRVALMYQSLNGKKQAYWNQKEKKWQKLSSRYNRAVETALQVAFKRQPPELLITPVPAPLPSTHQQRGHP